MHISIQEAADTYGLSDRTIRRYIAAGRLTAFRIGPRLIRLDPEQVRAQLIGPVVGGDAA
jgi:excisionase family DNA binding protein